MNEEQKFDDDVKSRLSDYEYPADSSWEEAKKVIISDEEKRRKSGFLYYTLAGLAIVAIGLPLRLKTPGTVKTSPEPTTSQRNDIRHDAQHSDGKQNSTPLPAKSAIVGNNNPIRPKISKKNNHPVNSVATPLLSGIHKPGGLSSNKPSIAVVQSQNMTTSAPENQQTLMTTAKNWVLLPTIAPRTMGSAQESGLSLQNIPPPLPFFKQVVNHIQIDAGAGYSSSITPLFGLSVRHYFSFRWSALAGIQFNEFSNLKNSYSSTISTYDFGINDSGKTIKPSTIYYLAIPLKIEYNFGYCNKTMCYVSSLCLGATLEYLENTSSTVTVFRQTQLNTIIYSEQSKPDYLNGINPHDVQLTLAYRRMLTGRFSFMAEGYYGLLSIENNDFFGNISPVHNRGVRLIVSYSFLKFK